MNYGVLQCHKNGNYSWDRKFWIGFCLNPWKKCEKCFQVTKGSFLTAGREATYPFMAASLLNAGGLRARVYLAALLSHVSSPKEQAVCTSQESSKPHIFLWFVVEFELCFKITACLSLISILNILQTQPVFLSCFTASKPFHCQLKT